MSLLWIEGFEVAATNTALQDKYGSGNYNGRFEAGRYHGKSYGTVLGSGVTAIDSHFTTPVFTSHSTWIIGLSQLAAFPTASGGSETIPGAFLQFNGSDQLRLEVYDYGDGDWYVSVVANGVELGRTDPIDRTLWHRLEAKIVLSDTAGTVEVRLDEETILTVSGVRTTTLTHAYANQFKFVMNNGNVITSLYAIDDIVIMNGDAETITFDGFTVSTNDFLGDVSVEQMYVEAAGTSSAWSPTGASPNYACVDEVDQSNGDTDYVSSSGNAIIDEYATRGPRVVNGFMLGLQLAVHARLTSAGLRSLKHSVRTGGVRTADGGRDVSSTSYVYTWSIWAYNPVTAKAWTAEELDAIEIGQELV